VSVALLDRGVYHEVTEVWGNSDDMRFVRTKCGRAGVEFFGSLAKDAPVTCLECVAAYAPADL
jgi:hypothetical protein